MFWGVPECTGLAVISVVAQPAQRATGKLLQTTSTISAKALSLAYKHYFVCKICDQDKMGLNVKHFAELSCMRTCGGLNVVVLLHGMQLGYRK